MFAMPTLANLPLTGKMQPSTLMSRMLGLLPAGHSPCFFLQAAFLKCLPADVRAHLVHDRTSDPLTLALGADEIFQSRVLVEEKSFSFMLSAQQPLLVLLFLPLLVPVLAVLLLLLPPLAAPPLLLLDSITDLMGISPRSVKLSAPGRKNNRPAEGCVLPSCRCFRFFSNLPPGPSLF